MKQLSQNPAVRTVGNTQIIGTQFPFAKAVGEITIQERTFTGKVISEVKLIASNNSYIPLVEELYSLAVGFASEHVGRSLKAKKVLFSFQLSADHGGIEVSGQQTCKLSYKNIKRMAAAAVTYCLHDYSNAKQGFKRDDITSFSVEQWVTQSPDMGIVDTQVRNFLEEFKSLESRW
jgi:hypothetical protein